jgi:delta(3,5)-delta(2,4)-dienoyl-CoA isomerase
MLTLARSMWLNLSSIFRQLSHDPNVRAVVLTGAGDRAFTAGLDVQAASDGGALAQKDDTEPMDAARKANGLRRHILEFQDCITDVEKCEKRM